MNVKDELIDRLIDLAFAEDAEIRVRARMRPL